MLRRILPLALIFTASAARAELASDSHAWPRVHLHYLQGDKVVRALCEQNTIIYNRDSCQADRQYSSAAVFFPKLASLFGVNLERDERLVRESWINIDQIELRIRQLVDLTPIPGEEVTWEQILDKQRQLSSVDAEIAGIKDQIARLLQALAERPDDVDDVQVLEIRRRELGDKINTRETLRRQLLDMRESYIEARANESDASYRDLMRMYNEAVDRLEAARRGVEQAVEDILVGEELARRLKEQGFSWVSTSHSPMPSVGKVTEAFDWAEVESRTLHVASDEPTHVLNLDITRSGRLQAVQCSFPVGENRDCYVAVTGPGNRSGVVEFDSSQDYLRLDTDAAEWQRRPLVEARLFGIDVAGPWRFEGRCSMISIGGPELTGKAECAVRLQPQSP